MVWRAGAAPGLNTVLAGVSEQIEPKEGTFDFPTVLDSVIQGARAHNLRRCSVVRSWKNGLSQLRARGVKTQRRAVPRAPDRGVTTPPRPRVGLATPPSSPGPVNIELISPFGRPPRGRCPALRELMRTSRQWMPASAPVVMIQVENESGVAGDPRPSQAARQGFRRPCRRINRLHSAAQGYPDSGVPQGVEAAGFKIIRHLGRGVRQRPAHGGIFMAWHFARYVDRVPPPGKAEYRAHVRQLPQDGSGECRRRSKAAEQERRPHADPWTVARRCSAHRPVRRDIYSPDYIGYVSNTPNPGTRSSLPATRRRHGSARSLRLWTP